MSEIKKIMIPTDFSTAADTAMKIAATLAGDDTSKNVNFIHVSSSAEGSEDELTSLKEQFLHRSKASCSTTCESGDLNEVLLKHQSETNYDLIVMGTKGSIQESEVTNTSKFVLDVDAPVLVVPETVPSFEFKNIALALGKEAIDDSLALNALHAIARQHGAKIHVLTISDDNEPLKEDETTEGVLEYYLETLDFHHAFPKNTDIEEGIAEYIKQHHIDLLAILPRNHAKKTKPSEGRLTELLTMHSKIPVLALD